jgi:hypothetical protein
MPDISGSATPIANDLRPPETLFRRVQGYLPWLLVGVTAVMALMSIGRAVTNTLSPGGATDFHQFWYAGHFVLQGVDPYQAFVNRIEPSLPVRYMDGPVVEVGQVAQPGLNRILPNTAPMVVLLSGFALFSWPVAKMIWLFCNLALVLLVPWMVLGIVDPDSRMATSTRLLVLFVFLAMVGTRSAVGVGQTTLLVFACMLGAVTLAEKRPMLSGILLGIALSKYSVGLAGFIFMLAAGQFLVAGVSLGVQLLGSVVLGLVTGSSVFVITGHYLKWLSWMVNNEGVHLAGALRNVGVSPLAIALLVTVIVGSLLTAWAFRRRSIGGTSFVKVAEGLPVFAVFLLWELLAGYHYAYDSLLAIFPIALMLFAVHQRGPWRLVSRERMGLLAVCAVTAAILGLPANLAVFIWSDWLSVHSRLVTLALVLQIVACIWLMFRPTSTPESLAIG